MHTGKWILLFIFFAFGCSCSMAHQKPELRRWPQIQAIAKKYHFPDALNATLNLKVSDVFGREVYVLHCRPGALILTPTETKSLPDDAPFWGDFACHLHSLRARDEYESLLIDDPLDNDESRSRGEFYFYTIQGNCADYPEWGWRRSFRLRGMKLKLELSEVQFGESPTAKRLTSFSFKVEVSPDLQALSAISEPPSYAGPLANPGDPYTLICDHPVPQHVPGVVTEEYVKELGLAPPYPLVPKMAKTFHIDPSREGPQNFPLTSTVPPRHFAEFQIVGRNANPLYNFVCVANRILFVDEIPQIAGDGLACGLFVVGAKTNLLQDSVDPFSRMSPAIILAKQLEGAAAKNPQWGDTRHFELRGLLLTLSFANPMLGKDEFGNPTLIHSDLTISVEPDSNAKEPVAGPPTLPYSDFFNDFGLG